jgi:hypothetical protein
MSEPDSPLLYIDLITQGGLLIQIIIGGLLSVTIFLGMWWTRTVGFVRTLWATRFGLKKVDTE